MSHAPQTLPPLTVVEASAGTGKTFSLVTRLLRLVFAGTPPERIAALTFSRAAAGEIFNTLVERLAKAAASDAAAAAEAEHVGGRPSRADFAAVLRTVVARQHLSLVGTLDSFLMKIVRALPFELGLEGDVKIMGDFRTPVERMRLVGELMHLQGDDAKRVWRDAFLLALDGAGAKSFLESFDAFIGDWHVRYRDRPARAAWGDPETIWDGRPPAGLDVSLAEIRACAGSFAAWRGKRGCDTFIEAVASFAGTPPKIPACMKDGKEPLADDVLRKMRLWCVARALRRTQGLWQLMHVYEAGYRAKVRSRGLVTFDDVPRLVGELPAGVRLPLEYRMDAKIDHWALDEFQDTSGGQWAALANLIDESRQSGGGRSVFIVGDRKQAIYEWRGGDVGILDAQVREAQKPGNEKRDLTASRRYLPRISAAVNRVFDEATIRGAFDLDDAPEKIRWACLPHVSWNKRREGFVNVVQAERHGRVARAEDFFAPVENELRAVRPWERGLTSAILVRKNEFGERLVAHLKSVGIDAVTFEGDARILDSPVLAAFVQLVHLAEHASDPYAYATIRHSPLAAALHPEGLPPPAALSAELLDAFTRLGLVRTFRDVREALKRIPGTWNDFTESRFADFVKCAAEFMDVRDERDALSAFGAYLERCRRREWAEPGTVRVMTMHQSKGLGFDHVIIPLYESDDLYGARHLGPLENENPAWLLDNPGASAVAADKTLSAAERRRRQTQLYASLCLNYVAMTRAKRALTLVLHPMNATPPKPGDAPARFSDLVRLVGLETGGDRDWFVDDAPAENPAPQARDDAAPLPCVVRRKREHVAKRRPSEAFFAGLSGARLFDADFSAAAERGRLVHAQYEKIRFLAQADAKDAFDRALVQPDRFVELWREKPYELYDPATGKWESGTFDRVVFYKDESANLCATVQDFKTNAVRPGETAAAFARRMREKYAPQMDAYRRAVGKLAGLDAARVKTALLLAATRAVVEV